MGEAARVVLGPPQAAARPPWLGSRPRDLHGINLHTHLKSRVPELYLRTYLIELLWDAFRGSVPRRQTSYARRVGRTVRSLSTYRAKLASDHYIYRVDTQGVDVIHINWEALGLQCLAPRFSDRKEPVAATPKAPLPRPVPIGKDFRSLLLDLSLKEEREGEEEKSRAAERVCVPARAASAPPPPRAVATTAAPRDRATEPEQRTGFAADLHAALASFSVLPEPPPTPAPEPTPPQAAQRPEAPASRPEKLGMGARVHPEVAEALSRLPDGGDAVRVLAGAALTEDEQRRVLERVLTVHRTQGIKSAGRFMHGQVRDALAARDRKAETVAAEAHDYVPDGGPFPDALRAPPGHLAAPPVRRPPPPRDPLVDKLNGERDRLKLMSAANERRPAQAAIVAEIEAQLARRKERRGLHLVPS